MGQSRRFGDVCHTSALPPNVLQNYFHDQNEQY
jgi:hypothetical protein